MNKNMKPIFKETVIVDTSVWIEYFKNNPRYVEIIESGLIKGNVYITGPIIAELLLGIKSDKEHSLLSSHIEAVPFLECGSAEWKKAGEISFIIRKSGLTIPLTDVIIAATAINNNASVLTLDAHFSLIPGVVLYQK